MNNLILLLFPSILYLSLLVNTILASNYIPKDHILLNCGSFDPQTTDSDSRKWSSDYKSNFLSSSNGSFRAIAATKSRNVPKVPYNSARIFYSKITYTFPISSHGRVFLRLYFYPNTYSRSNATINALFSVDVGTYTLLKNFDAYKTTRSLGVEYVVKEYYINVGSGELVVTFSPSDMTSFGFVNGIEVVSVPKVYDNEVGVSILGASSPFTIDGSTALESLYRLNVGGSYVPPTKDTGLSRSWFEDTKYIFGSQFGAANSKDPNVNITFPNSLPSYTAPIDVYSTARFMTPDNFLNLKFNLTWSLSIDNGFTYLVRLHFCEIFSNIDKVNQIVFNIFLNNETAYSGVDVIALTESNGVPYFMDFVVILPSDDGGDSKQDLWVALNPDTSDKPEYYNAFLNGLEIFKINNTDGSFAL